LTVLENTTHEGVEAAALDVQAMWDWLAQQRLEPAAAEAPKP